MRRCARVSLSLHLASLLQGQASSRARLDDLHPLCPPGPFRLNNTAGNINNKKKDNRALSLPTCEAPCTTARSCSTSSIHIGVTCDPAVSVTVELLTGLSPKLLLPP